MLMPLLPGEPADPSDVSLIGQPKFKLTPQRPLQSQKPGLVKRKVRGGGLWALGVICSLDCWTVCLQACPDMLEVKLAGFVEEMRFVAMKLHTKDQAPKEGGKEAAPQPFQKVLTCGGCPVMQ